MATWQRDMMIRGHGTGVSKHNQKHIVVMCEFKFWLFFSLSLRSDSSGQWALLADELVRQRPRTDRHSTKSYY